MLSGMGLRAFANQAIEGVEIGRSGITCYVSEVTEPSLRQTVGAAEERAFRVTRSMKRWNWRRAFYYAGLLAFLFVPPLFGDVGKLYSIGGGGAYVLCDLWLRKTRRGQTFREAAAEVFDQRWCRQTLQVLARLCHFRAHDRGKPAFWGHFRQIDHTRVRVGPLLSSTS